MLRSLIILGWLLVVIGLGASILGTAALLAQQLLLLGVTLLVGAMLWSWLSAPSDDN